MAQFSNAGLQPLPKPITSEVQKALMYANSLVFGRLMGSPEPAASSPSLELRAVSPISLETEEIEPEETKIDEIKPVRTPSPLQIEISTQASACPTEDKCVMTLPEESCPSPPLVEEPQCKETVEVALQTTEETVESIVASPGIRRGRSRGKVKKPKGISAEMLNDWQEKQARIADLAAKREAEEQLAKEQLAQTAAQVKAQQLQARKELLATKHAAAEEERRKRHQQWKATASNLRRLDTITPLHERLEAKYHAVELREEEKFQQELEKVKERMRRVDSQEIEEHELRYASVRDTIESEYREMRHERLQVIKEANRAKDYFRSPLLDVELKERRADESRREQQSARAREILTKRRMYSQLVMEIHKPLSFLPPSPLPKRKPRPTVSDSPLKKRTALSTRTPKPTNTFELPQQKSVSEVSTVTRDYNSERRQALERSILLADNSIPMFTYEGDDEDTQDLRGLHDKAGRLEHQAKRQERFIHRLDQRPELQAQACDSVSALYLDSIKAKLRIVNSLFL